MSNLVLLKKGVITNIPVIATEGADSFEIAFSSPLDNVPLSIYLTSSTNQTFLMNGRYSHGQSMILPYESDSWEIAVRLNADVSRLSISILFNNLLNNYRTDKIVGGEYV